MIYKYNINNSPISLPQGSKVLTAGRQGHNTFVWVDLGYGELQDYLFDYVGTGWDIDTSNMIYISTIFEEDGYVWHVYYKVLNDI